jgi:ABC-type glycerol-3-phosphate transport system substrate-binding protein
MMAYIRTGKIDPVPDSFLSRAQIADKYYSSTLALLDYNNKYYGIPSNLSADQTRVLLVNDQIVNDAKVNLDDNQTMDDFIKDWQALTVVGTDGKMTRAGLGMVCAEPPYQFTSYLMEYGGSILTEDGKKAALNSDAGKKAFQFMMDLIEKYKVDSPDLTDFSCLGTGTAATSYRGTWFVPVLQADYPDFKYHFIKMPLPPGASVELWNGGSGWATFVPSNSANKDAAW